MLPSLTSLVSLLRKHDMYRESKRVGSIRYSLDVFRRVLKQKTLRCSSRNLTLPRLMLRTLAIYYHVPSLTYVVP